MGFHLASGSMLVFISECEEVVVSQKVGYIVKVGFGRTDVAPVNELIESPVTEGHFIRPNTHYWTVLSV